MKILVVGLGSIGRRHIKNLKGLDSSLEVAVLRQHSKSVDLEDVTPLVTRVFLDEQQALAWKPQVAVIANPAPWHISAALPFAGIGAHLFIEKPLSTSLQEVETLAQVCQDKDLVAMVGYVLRFSRPLMALKDALDNNAIGRVLSVQAQVGCYLPQWRPSGDYRNQVSARRELGGGVVLELSHEIDYVRWLAGEALEVSAMAEKTGDLDTDVEDLAEIHLRLEKGVLAHIHLDMLDRAAARGCRIIGSEGTLVWQSQGTAHDVRIFTAADGQWQVLYEAKNLDTNDMHKTQWEHFLDGVHHGKPIVTGLKEGTRVLHIALEALRSAKERSVITL